MPPGEAAAPDSGTTLSVYDDANQVVATTDSRASLDLPCLPVGHRGIGRRDLAGWSGGEVAMVTDRSQFVYDEEQIAAQLVLLPGSSRVLFACACAERMMPTGEHVIVSL
jgi:hypothetical protein